MPLFLLLFTHNARVLLINQILISFSVMFLQATNFHTVPADIQTTPHQAALGRGMRRLMAFKESLGF